MAAPLTSLGKLLLLLRVFQWIFAIIVIGTAASAISGAGHHSELRPFYAALAFTSFIVLFHSIWIPLAFLSTRRPFYPFLALILDIILFISLFVIGICAAASHFSRNCYYGSRVPNCSKLRAASVFIFLLALSHAITAALNYLEYKRHRAGYGKDFYDMEAVNTPPAALEADGAHPHHHHAAHPHQDGANYTAVQDGTATTNGAPIAAASSSVAAGPMMAGPGRTAGAAAGGPTASAATGNFGGSTGYNANGSRFDEV